MWGKSLVIAAAFAASTAIAQAAPVIDQSALVAPAQSYRSNLAGVITRPTGNIINALVQTVTAGTTGRLDAIDLQLRRVGTGFVNFTLFDGDGSLPGAQVVYNTGIDLATLPLLLDAGILTTVDVSAANFVVTPGQLFSFALGPANPLDQPGAVAVLTGGGPAGNGPPTANDYAGGTLKVTTNLATYIPINADLGFRTRVSALAAAVPEPASWALMVVGFGLIGGAMRVRRPIGMRSASLG